MIAALQLAACAGSRSATGGHAHANPQIISAGYHLHCVPYARAQSGINIYGDAHTWWAQAGGRYSRGQRPATGSVLVLDSGGKRGHLAVVTRLVSAREIVVNHANWLNSGEIYLDTPVIDVSPRNDWSAVRVWYTPGRQYGTRVYRAQGFIYPPATVAKG